MQTLRRRVPLGIVSVPSATYFVPCAGSTSSAAAVLTRVSWPSGRPGTVTTLHSARVVLFISGRAVTRAVAASAPIATWYWLAGRAWPRAEITAEQRSGAKSTRRMAVGTRSMKMRALTARSHPRCPVLRLAGRLIGSGGRSRRPRRRPPRRRRRGSRARRAWRPSCRCSGRLRRRSPCR